ncbi:MAG: MtrB/PioB family decaheme-associated outer membrane protein [Burkholderiales bacterium]|nr:MtrB/PioB family decaheme-associated outer membrane protein [Burkholderiales bacterium]
MKTSNQLLLLGMLSALSPAAAADGTIPAGVDISKWKCESCKFEKGTSGTVDVGAGSVSDKSAEFGQYNGLYEKGGYFIGDADVRSRGEDGAYWNLNASNLGLDTRSVDAEGGKQGSYKLRLKYDETPHRIWDGAQTPFSGAGGASLTLPAGFAAGTTGAMPLAGAMQSVDLYTQRNQLGVGASWVRSKEWEYGINVRHETREGNILRTGGAFFVNTAQLVDPVDYVTDQVDASASYSGKKFQLKLAYYGSKFSNGNHSLTWQDPYTPVNGETMGQLALPPDNQFHQIQASGGYQFGDKTRGSADIAFGRMTQNDNFLPSTLNATLAVPGLPGSSLNARAATLDANLKLSSAVTDKLRLSAAYVYSDRDNQTSQAAYPSVATDMFVGTARTNLPYSYTQDKLKLSADYRASARLRGSVGADFDTHKRSYQDVDKTSEDTLWGKLSSRVTDKIDLTLKLAQGERRFSGTYQVVPEITPPENPLLRRFNMANRTRETAGLRADFALMENVNFGLGVDSSDDKYSDSSIGLTSARDLSYNGDLTVAFSARTSMHLFANRQEIKSKQAGSQAFSSPDWFGETKDTIDFFGLGLKYVAIPDKLDIGADYGYTASRSEISVNNGASDPSFPNITTKLNSVKLYATYRMKENMSLLAGYWYERYDTRDWMSEGVGPATIPNVLTMGLQSPQYKVNVVRLALRYKF